MTTPNSTPGAASPPNVTSQAPRPAVDLIDLDDYAAAKEWAEKIVHRTGPRPPRTILVDGAAKAIAPLLAEIRLLRAERDAALAMNRALLAQMEGP